MDREQVLKKIKGISRKAGREVAVKALTLWYCMIDASTPTRIKALIFGDLAYLISPLDVVPDPLPVVGFSDDLGVLVGTLALIAVHIKKSHHDSAKNTVAAWFGER